jgi:uncharacterized protein (DUF1684 family)
VFRSVRGRIQFWLEGVRDAQTGDMEMAMNKLAKQVVGVVLVTAGVGMGVAQNGPDYAKLRADRAQGLTEPYGWFSLVALDYLKPGVTTVGSAKDNSLVLGTAPAHLVTLEQDGGRVVVQSAAPSVTVAGQPVAGTTHPEVPKGERDKDAIASGTLKMWAIDRGGKRYLRVKDSNAPALKNFHGLNWYGVDGHYRVEAKWVPYTTPHTINVLNKIGQMTPTPVPGYVEFQLNGKKETLVPMEADEKRLFFVFRDPTAAVTTYGGGRFLYTAPPSNGVDKAGTVTLDFNQAVNPPCAYSPYATCPLATKENRLPVAVNAGEKIYDKGIE